jgi:DNA-binding NarL/FixJ family response regulator
MIRVLVADDHPLARAGLAQMLGELADITVVGAASDGEQAVALAHQTTPDVVLMDLEMPVLDGIEATRRLAAELPEARTVVLTSFSDQARILDALDAGAIGYLLKDADPDELARGIRTAARGESPLAPKAASAIISLRERRRPAALLTDREREILTLVAEGLPNKLIARRLHITERTVKGHLTRIFERIGVTDRTQAALWARERRLL